MHDLICFSYRVLAVDHDLISFVDVRLNTWPVVLITNPKDAHYIMRPHEPLGRMRKSTHIRSLEYQFSRTTVISDKLLAHFSNSLLFFLPKRESFDSGLINNKNLSCENSILTLLPHPTFLRGTFRRRREG